MNDTWCYTVVRGLLQDVLQLASSQVKKATNEVKTTVTATTEINEQHNIEQ